MTRTPHTRSNRRGQTLIEAIVALAVLTAGFLGIVTLLAKSFAINRQNSDVTTATYLAAEGIELAKNIIDHGMYTYASTPGEPWACFPISAVDYQLDFSILESNPTTCTSLSGNTYHNTGKILLRDTTPSSPYFGMYGYSGSFPGGDTTVSTGFVRDIAISFPAASNGTYPQAVVRATVRWGAGQAVVLEDHFYNWLP